MVDCRGDESPRNDDGVFGWMERDSFAACSLCRAAAMNRLAMTSRKGLAMMNKKMVRSGVYKKRAMKNRPFVACLAI